MTEANLEGLYALKAQKLQEQKILSDQASELLNKLNESSRLTQKNLKAAIAVARQPGYFEYYKPPEDVKSSEDGKVLNQYARQIAAKHKELEHINAEIAQATSKSKTSQAKMEDIPLMGLSHWFDTYGRPKASEQEDMLTTFSASPKIYGGTGHHRSFKSSSTIMRSGRITR